ncbi:MAG: NAD(P)/FAD-dependent oxidoreductase [Pseudomonadota bacterium]
MTLSHAPTEDIENTDTLVVGGGQAGLAISEHLSAKGVAHVVLERGEIAQRWRSERWDSLVANGPAWHDRFASMEFSDVGPDGFASKHSVIRYFEEFATKMNVPIRCGVDVTLVEPAPDGAGYMARTSQGPIKARNVVAATGPFQNPAIPPVVPELAGVTQMHSTAYRNPGALTEGAVLVVGAGSSGCQIAEEILASGREVYLSVGPHDRPPRRYRGRDFVWWLGALGKWQMRRPAEGAEHVTIAVSGANGGQTIDFRRLASNGMTLLGMTDRFSDGILHFANDLGRNIARGDANYLSVLDEADAYITAQGLDMPPEPEARIIRPDPACLTEPVLQLDLAQAGVRTIIWATGFRQDFDWLKVDAFDDQGTPQHDRGVSVVPGVYFLGLPWLSMRGSSFIWGVWEDAKYLADHISISRER